MFRSIGIFLQVLRHTLKLNRYLKDRWWPRTAMRTLYWAKCKCKCGKVWNSNLWDYQVLDILIDYRHIPTSYLQEWCCGECHKRNNTSISIRIKESI